MIGRVEEKLLMVVDHLEEEEVNFFLFWEKNYLGALIP